MRLDRAHARRVLDLEADAIRTLAGRLDHRFDLAIDCLVACRGHVILTGIGKSGIIARKIAATLTCTGTPAVFLHPAEARHGDLGLLQSEDVVIAISKSGETEELGTVIAAVHRKSAMLIAMTGQPDSTLGRAARVVLDCSVPHEADPWGLMPTASTTSTLALGDALAVALMQQKGFTAQQLADLHPGGSIGKALRDRVPA